MEVTGTAVVRLKANNIHIETEALISPAIIEGMLVSCGDLTRLKIIPPGFPNTTFDQCRAVTDQKAALIKEFEAYLGTS